MALILAYKNRGLTRDIKLVDKDSAAITPKLQDQVRVSIGRIGEVAKLVITTDNPTANGSSITKGAANRLRLDASDLGFDVGLYSLFVEFYDFAEDSWFSVDRQLFCLKNSVLPV